MRALLAAVLVGCGSPAEFDSGSPPATGAGAGEPTTTAGTTSSGPLSHEADIVPIWQEVCGTSCHLLDDDGGLTLAYENLVSVPSEDVPEMNRVEPGSLEDSYLWHKIEGTHLSVGGAGSTMPRGLLELKPKQRQKIERWITEGALP